MDFPSVFQIYILCFTINSNIHLGRGSFDSPRKKTKYPSTKSLDSDLKNPPPPPPKYDIDGFSISSFSSKIYQGHVLMTLSQIHTRNK